MTELKKIDWNRPWRLRNGVKARYLGRLDRAYSPNILAATSPEGEEFLVAVSDAGEFVRGSTSNLDVIQEPIKRTIRVWENSLGQHIFRGLNETPGTYWKLVKEVEIEI